MERYTKRVDKTLSEQRFSTLRLLQESCTVTEISRIRKVYRSAVYKTIASLQKKGYIENVGTPNLAVYNLTKKGLEGIHSFVALRYKLRSHNLSFKIEVLENPKNWDKKRQQLIRLPFFNKRIELKNNDQDLFTYQKLEIKTTTKSVIIKLPEIFAKNTEGAILQAMDMLYSAIPNIERIFKVKLVKDYKANITIISQEWARLQDSLAKLYRIEEKKLYVRDDEGKIWLIADYSFKTDELETIRPESSDDDMDVVHKHMNDLRDNNPRPLSLVDKELTQAKDLLLQQNKEVVNLKGVFPAMSEYNENLKLHTAVQQAQLETQKETLKFLKLVNEKLEKS